jgi:hypothetical protein
MDQKSAWLHVGCSVQTCGVDAGVAHGTVCVQCAAGSDADTRARAYPRVGGGSSGLAGWGDTKAVADGNVAAAKAAAVARHQQHMQATSMRVFTYVLRGQEQHGLLRRCCHV